MSRPSQPWRRQGHFGDSRAESGRFMIVAPRLGFGVVSMSGIVASILCCCAETVVASDVELPAALRQFQERRMALRSGDVLWSRQDFSHRQPGEFHFVSRYARNGDRIFEHRGDADGWVSYDASGRPNSRLPLLYLRTSDSIWRRLGGNVGSHVWKFPAEEAPEDSAPAPDEASSPDIRLLGLCGVPDTEFDAGWEVFAKLDPGSSPDGEPLLVWQETVRGDRVEVTATNHVEGLVSTWSLVPAKDWNPERIVHQTPHGSEYIFECELQPFEGGWFPRRADLFVNGELYTTITVQDAAFNRPDDPEHFMPADIGIEPGFNISGQNFREPPGEVWVWDGETLVLQSEWFDMLHRGLRQRGPTLEARGRGELNPYYTEEQIRAHHALFHPQAPADAAATGSMMEGRTAQSKPAGDATISEWERYVLTFIERYRLDEDQRARAMEILARCQALAQRYLDRHAVKIAEAERRVLAHAEGERRASVNAGGASGDRTVHDAAGDARAAACDTLSRLMRPIDDIFDKELKPRIEQLPTPQQRARTDGAAATRPAAP